MTLESVNQMRALQGLEPLTELPTEENNGNLGAEEVKQGNPEDTKADSSLDGSNPEENKKTEDTKSATVVTNDLTDEEILSLLNKKGIAVKSFEELMPKPKEDDEETKEAKKLSYGLQKGLIKKSEYENFVIDKKDINNLVYAEFHADYKADDPDATDEDIQDEFTRRYGLSEEASSKKFQRGQKEIKILADKILKEKYAKMFDLDRSYNEHESKSKADREYHQKITSKAPEYKKDVEDIVNEFKTIKTKFTSGDEYSITVIEDALSDLKQSFLDPSYAELAISSDWSKEVLKETMYNRFITKNLNTLLEESAKQHLLKHQAGTRGIPAIQPQGQQKTTSNFTPEQEKFIQIHKEANPSLAVAN